MFIYLFIFSRLNSPFLRDLNKSVNNMWCVALFGTICTIEKREKHPTKSNTPPWVFFAFLNYTNGSKSCNVSQIIECVDL